MDLDKLTYDIIYRSEDLLVRSCLFKDNTVCVVTFGSFTDIPTLERDGFGEDFFKKNCISAVHIINRNNVWYNYEDFDKVIYLINKKIEGFEKIITYGSSMGGFGAIFYAEKLNAQDIIAISPQYHIASKIVKFENRWKSILKENKSLKRGFFHGSSHVRPLIIYDPLDLDVLHATLIKKYYPKTIEIKVMHAGHPCGAYLDEVGQLRDIILSVIYNNLDIDNISGEVRKRRKLSAHYYFNLARRLKGHHFKLKMALTEKAIHFRKEPVFYQYSALLAEITGNFPLAEQRYRYAESLGNDNIYYTQSLLYYLFRQGRLLEAFDQVKRMISSTDKYEIYFLYAVLLCHLSDFDEIKNNSKEIKLNKLTIYILKLYPKSWLASKYVDYYANKIFGLTNQINIQDEANNRKKIKKKINRYNYIYGNS